MGKKIRFKEIMTWFVFLFLNIENEFSTFLVTKLLKKNTRQQIKQCHRSAHLYAFYEKNKRHRAFDLSKVKCYKVLKQRCRSCTTHNQVTAESKIINIYT